MQKRCKAKVKIVFSLLLQVKSLPKLALKCPIFPERHELGRSPHLSGLLTFTLLGIKTWYLVILEANNCQDKLMRFVGIDACTVL